MSDQIIGLHEWFETPPGQYLLDWERRCFEQGVADIFGYHGLQLGLPILDTLAANRMPHHWRAVDTTLPAWGGVAISLRTDFTALPLAPVSLDLVTLPHTLELSLDPHATLREVERVLVPEGRVVLSCINPVSLWGLAQRRARLYQRLGGGRLYLPEVGEFIGYWRLRDWLRLLGFEVESVRFGCYRPAVRGQRALDRMAWMERLGDRWWPILGAAYFIVAIKRVHGMRLLSPSWKSAPVRAGGQVSVANRHGAKTQATETQKERL